MYDDDDLKNARLLDFSQRKPGDQIWWTGRIPAVMGEYLFSFDKKRIYNLFRDYPYALTEDEKEIFDRENPYWAEFFAWRSE